MTKREIKEKRVKMVDCPLREMEVRVKACRKCEYGKYFAGQIKCSYEPPEWITMRIRAKTHEFLNQIKKEKDIPLYKAIHKCVIEYRRKNNG